jgi:hypothetical protein
MSDDTPILNLPLILPAQAQKHVTHNEALRLLDITVQLAVRNRDLNTAPANPAEGDRYIVGPAPTGAWAGRAGQIAAFWGGVWVHVPPGDGWQARVLDEAVTLVHQGGIWSPASGLPENIPRLGINASTDATNRLAVASAATLLSHDGAGHQIKVNKAAPADTASLLFQTAFSGRAEIGLAGDDTLSVKVSPDGTAFQTALSADPATGRITLPQGLTAPLRLRDGADPTRSATFDLSALSTGTQRSYSLPDISSQIAALGGSQTFDGAKTFSGTLTATTPTATIGTATGNSTYGLGTGATVSGSTKTVQIGTGGAAGSTTHLSLGPTQPGAGGTLTLNGATVTLGATVTNFDMGSASAQATVLGIGGALGDGTTRLSVNSPGILFNHAGSGVEAALNKANPAAHGVLSFRSGQSARAQLGLIGSDDLSLRVSADGMAFTTVLTADSATARASFAQPVTLAALSTDPASPPDGTLWHNGTTAQLCARLGGQTLRLDGMQDIPCLVPPAGELIATTTGAGGAVVGAVTGAAGRLDLFPFVPRAEFAIDRAVLNCTTSVAGALARVLLYASDPQGRPAFLLTESTDIDLTAIGARIGTLTGTLRQGRTYWIGLRTSGVATVTAWATSATPDINGGTMPTTLLRKVLRRTVAWGTPTPASWGYTSTEINPAAAAAIWLRIA